MVIELKAKRIKTRLLGRRDRVLIMKADERGFMVRKKLKVVIRLLRRHFLF